MKTIQQFLLRPWLYLGIVIIGIALKFYSIESKYFWYDEIETIMHTSGISDKDYPSLVSINEVKSINYYSNILHLNAQNYTIASQLKGLFSMPQLAPLHPALLIFWHRIVGDDLIDYRLFNVFLFLLTLPFLFLLCKTLFQSNLAGWIAITLFSVSPFFNVYTQEARYIMLWTFFIIAIHYIFLKAMYNNKLKWWVGYAILAVLILYTSLLSAIVIFGHLIFIWIFRKDLRLVYSINIFVVFLIYLPWIIIMFNNQEEILRSMYWQKYWKEIHIWIPLLGELLGFTHIFAIFEGCMHDYLELFMNGKPTYGILKWLVIDFVILILIIYSIIYFFRKSSRNNKAFLILTTILSILFIYVIDISRNGYVAYIWRYHVIGFIGVFLIVVNIFAEKIKQKQIIFTAIFIILVTIGIVSDLKVPRNPCWTMYWRCKWWDNYMMAEKISKADKPLIITDFTFWAGMGGFLEVMAQLESDNIDILYTSPDNKEIENVVYGNDYSDVIIMHASKELVQNVKLVFGKKVDSLEYLPIEWGTPMWQIKLD